MNVGENMVYTCKYKSLIGDILLAADEIGLTGLWFVGQKYYAHGLPDESIWQETKILTETRRWLDIYFSGDEPKFTPPLHPAGRPRGKTGAWFPEPAQAGPFRPPEGGDTAR